MAQEDISFNGIKWNGMLRMGESIANPYYNNILITDNTVLLGSLEVSGNTNLKGNLNLHNNLEVSGNTKLKGELDISYAEVKGNLNLNNNLIVNGDTRLKGDLNLHNNLNISGSTFINKGINVSGDLVVDGTIKMKGFNFFEQYNLQKGVKGDQGDIGIVGPRGAQGFKGMQGNNGLKGNMGANAAISSEWSYLNNSSENTSIKGFFYLVKQNGTTFSHIHDITQANYIIISNYDAYNRGFKDFYTFLISESENSVLQLNSTKDKYSGGIFKLSYDSINKNDILNGINLRDVENLINNVQIFKITVIQKYIDSNNISINQNFTAGDNIFFSFSPLYNNNEQKNKIDNLQNQVTMLNEKINNILINL